MKPTEIPDPLREKLRRSGTAIEVRVTPKASRNRVELGAGDSLRIYVTVVPESGKANQAVVKLLAKTLGLAKSDLVLERGDASRDKLFRVR